MSASTYSITDNQQGDTIDVGTPDWNAKEQGAFPPDLYPGTSTFTFHLQNGEAPEKTPFEVIEVGEQKVKTLQVNYKATYEKTVGEKTFERTVGFQRASFYQSEPMRAAGMNSQGVELLRALGLSNLTPLTQETIQAALQQADGRVQFTASHGWEAYDKEKKVTVTTTPNKKQVAAGKNIPWPRNAEGKFEAFITPPSGGNKVTGRTTITAFKLPKTT